MQERFPENPSLELVFEARVQVDPPLILGEAGGRQRRIVPILGGRVEGPRLNGEVLAGGADWQRTRAKARAAVHDRRS